MTLAEGGQARVAIVIRPGGSGQTRVNTSKLAHVLHSIIGARFELSTGNGSTCIALGRADDFPALLGATEVVA